MIRGSAVRRRAPWRDRLYTVVFESDTPAGRLFDQMLLVAIVLSVLAVLLESVPEVRAPCSASSAARGSDRSRRA